MKKLLIALALVAGANAQAFDIVDALNRGQQVALEKCAPEDMTSEEAKIIVASFIRVKAASGYDAPVPLRIARCNAMVQVLAGIVVAHPAIANWNEGERMFVLAHELGHIINGDWHTFTEAFATFVPTSTPEDQVDAAMRRSSRQASELMHSFEYGADSFARQLLARMGRDSVADGCAALRRDVPMHSSPTHPGTMQRIASLMHTH